MSDHDPTSFSQVTLNVVWSTVKLHELSHSHRTQKHHELVSLKILLPEASGLQQDRKISCARLGCAPSHSGGGKVQA